MKKLIPMQGRGIKAVAELGEGGAVLRPPLKGQLWLYDGSLVRAEECTAPDSVRGAVLVREGSAVAWGGIGSGEKAARIMGEAVLRTAPAVPSQGTRPAPAPGESRPSPGEKEAPAHSPGAALIEILKKAEELFPPVQPPQRERREADAVLNPFPEAFPLSRWHRREYPGTNRHYLEGEWLSGGVTYAIYALPGEPSGRRHRGFSRFLRARDGSGYWVKVQRR